MEKARYNTELYSNLRVPLNNVKPSNFWGSLQFTGRKLSKEDKANPRGLGEAPVPGTENSRTIDIKMTKRLEIQCVRNSL